MKPAANKTSVSGIPPDGRDSSKGLWTAEKAAKLLSCSVQHVLRLAILGILPAIDLSPPNSKQKMWRFRPEKIEEWIRWREKHKE